MGERHSYPSTMGERYRHSSIITLTYDQIMEVADLIYFRVEYNECENIPKNIRLLYEFDIIKEIMRSLCSTNIPSIETIRQHMGDITEELIDYKKPPLYRRGGKREMSPGKKKLIAIMFIGVLLLTILRNGAPNSQKTFFQQIGDKK